MGRSFLKKMLHILLLTIHISGINSTLDDAEEPNPASPHHHTTSDDRLVLLCGHLTEKSRARPETTQRNYFRDWSLLESGGWHVGLSDVVVTDIKGDLRNKGTNTKRKGYFQMRLSTRHIFYSDTCRTFSQPVHGNYLKYFIFQRQMRKNIQNLMPDYSINILWRMKIFFYST
jgi:hypothetical protein